MIEYKGPVAQIRRMFGMVLGAFVLVGCGDPIGAPCDFQGSGFTATNNCRYRCLEHRPIDCPGGARINPHICSGPQQCMPGSCTDGQVCVHTDDPFQKESFCVPADVCGVLGVEALADWEQATLQKSANTLRIWKEKQERREQWQKSNPNKVTKPATPDDVQKN